MYREIKHGISKSVCLDKVVIFYSNAYIILRHIAIDLSIRVSRVGTGLILCANKIGLRSMVHLKFNGCKQYHEQPIWPIMPEQIICIGIICFMF